MAADPEIVPYLDLDVCRRCGTPLRDDEYPTCRECDDELCPDDEDDPEDEMCDAEDDA